jgi:hypothetical protein
MMIYLLSLKFSTLLSLIMVVVWDYVDNLAYDAVDILSISRFPATLQISCTNIWDVLMKYMNEVFI